MTAFPGEPGLQRERTALAWQRTAVTATVVIIPLVVVNARLGAWLLTVLASSVTMAAGVLVVGVHRRFSQLRKEQSLCSPFGPMLRVAVATGLAALVGLATGLGLVWR